MARSPSYMLSIDLFSPPSPLHYGPNLLLSRTVNAKAEEGYDKNLVSTHEVTQDDALKKLYAEYEKGIVRKQKMLDFCLTLGHKIMPSIAIWFVLSYWTAGLFQYNGLDFLLNIITEIIFTFFYYVGLFFLNYFWRDISQFWQN